MKEIKLGKILGILKHPNADKLNIAVLDIGGKVKAVITGASNIKENDIVPFLTEGNVVPGYLLLQGEKVVLGKKMLRGLESDSMVLAEDEIGIGTDHTGIWIIEAENKDELIGKSILEVLDDNTLNSALAAKSEEVHF
ncbi:hypothetical protein IH575_01075 [Candidatus Dojkabacteria bacterium]|nr:hypothetical protein [Candidatus Dojkabacteria bacterium]